MPSLHLVWWLLIHDGIMGRARGHFLLASLLLRGWLVAGPLAGWPA